MAGRSSVQRNRDDVVEGGEGILRNQKLEINRNPQRDPNTLFRFLPLPNAFVLRALTATKILTLSPTLEMPSSFKTEWSHSSRVSPVMLFPTSRVSRGVSGGIVFVMNPLSKTASYF